MRGPPLPQVDPIYSVQFSNHTGYPTFKGSVFDGSHLRALVEGLRVNGLLTHTHLLTGGRGLAWMAMCMCVVEGGG